MTSRLSLWVSPAAGSSNEKAWMQASSEAGSMVSQEMTAILPHVTLASWTEPYPEVSLKEFRKQAPFRLRPVASVQNDESFWMCLFAEMSPQTELLRLRELAQAIRPDIRSGAYRPHVSLVYGNVDSTTKLMVARAMDCFIPPTFACDRVCLVDTSDEEHTKWKIVAETKLEGKSESSEEKLAVESSSKYFPGFKTL